MQQKGMSKLTERHARALKHLARYLLEVPEVVLVFPWAEEEEMDWLIVHVDSDWAGCRSTRKSTSGGVMSICGGNLKSWSKTQGPVALSSGEAEYYSLVKGATEGLGLQSLAEDLGWQLKVFLWVDSSAAKSMASRKGVGRVRHIQVRELWLQDAVRQQRLAFGKYEGTKNPADVLTTPKVQEDITRLFWMWSAWVGLAAWGRWGRRRTRRTRRRR